MKQLKCEMCGSTDVLKQEGVFVCQNCGTKHSVDEINPNIDNYLLLAQNALEGNDYVACDNYVNKILEIDSVNTDAYFLKIKSLLVKQRFGYNEKEQTINEFDFINNIEKQKSSYYSIMIDKCIFSDKHIKNVMDFVMDDFFGDVYGYNHQNLYSKILSTDLMVYVLKKVNNSSDDEIVQAFYGVYNNAKDNDESTAKMFLRACSRNQEYNLVSKNIAESFYGELIRIEIYEILDAFPEIDYTIKEMLQDINLIKDNDEISYIKESIDTIRIYVNKIRTFNPAYEIDDDEIIELNKILNFWINGHYKDHAISAYNKIKKINPKYTIDSNLEDTIKSYQAAEKQSGCYVATCVYGSYDCPQVWTLRRYRDYTLAETWYGRAFIKTYYAISPTIVKWFGNTDWFKKLWREKLDKMVNKLNKCGYENTKYNDKF